MRVVFGTDGVRDVANVRLTPEAAFAVSRVGLGTILEEKLKSGSRLKVVIGMDTRISGAMLEAATACGAASLGIDVLRAGVIPTPAVAHLVKELGADAGIVISASHNPYEYNGIKFFGGDGYKLGDELERTIERNIEVLSPNTSDGLPRPGGDGVGRLSYMGDAVERYINFVVNSAEVRLDGMKVVLDCANGSSYATSPEAFRRLGAEVTVINDFPDGVNINEGCGSLHLEQMIEEVKRTGADIGIAHDGDADRLMVCDHMGNTVDGDGILAICGTHLKNKGILKGDAIVATQYSNMGLSEAMGKLGCDVVLAGSGDRYVLDEMRRRGLVLGGEQSGHIIFLDLETTGDGLMSAVQLCKVMKEADRSLHELSKVITYFPQKMRNVKVSNKDAFKDNQRIKQAVTDASKRLEGDGRVFVRSSGTEPLIRVMVEARDVETVDDVLNKLVAVIEEERL